jgi:Fe2+ or Zn2+ uptake regulation protein
VVNVTPKREAMREHLMSAYHHITQAQSLYEEFEQALEVIESQAKHFRTTRRIDRRMAQERGQ